MGKYMLLLTFGIRKFI